MLEESEAKYEHERENAIGAFVDLVTSSAKRGGNEALFATFEKTRADVAQNGVKAAASRKKNTVKKADR